MEREQNPNPRSIIIDVCKLHTPEYHRKEEIEGRELQLIQSIANNGVISPIIVNRNPERMNIIVNGVSVDIPLILTT